MSSMWRKIQKRLDTTVITADRFQDASDHPADVGLANTAAADVGLLAEPGADDVHVTRDELSGVLLPVTRSTTIDLSRRYMEAFTKYEKHVKRRMTPEAAAAVRQLRCKEHQSWRGVAHKSHAAWGEAWSPPWNQLAGMALCEQAAKHYGEDYRQEPWN